MSKTHFEKVQKSVFFWSKTRFFYPNKISLTFTLTTIHHREGIGIIVTDLIRSYLILMSIVAIGLIVIKFLTAKTFSTIIPIDKSIVFIASDRNTSYHIATDRIYSCTSIAAIATNRGQGERHDVIRSPTICCDLSRCIDRDLIRLVHEQIRYNTIRYG